MPRAWLTILLATHSTRAQSEAERTQQQLLKEAVELQAKNATGNGKFPLSTGAWFLTDSYVSNAKQKCDDCSYMLDTALAGCLSRFFQGHDTGVGGAVLAVPQPTVTAHEPRLALQAPGCTPGSWAGTPDEPVSRAEPDGRRSAAVRPGRSRETESAPFTTQADSHRARRGDRAVRQGHTGVGPDGPGRRVRRHAGCREQVWRRRASPNLSTTHTSYSTVTQPSHNMDMDMDMDMTCTRACTCHMHMHMHMHMYM